MFFRHGMLAVAGVVVAVALLAAVGTASANRLSVSETTIRGRSNLIEFVGSEPRFIVRCASASSTGTITRTIAKVEGTRIGGITEFGASMCVGAGFAVTTRALNMPWPGFYVSYSGTLPEITGLTGRSTVAWTLGIPALNTTCTFEGSVFGLSPVSRGVITTGRILTELTTLRLIESTGPFRMVCPTVGTLTGEGMATTPVTVTLI